MGIKTQIEFYGYICEKDFRIFSHKAEKGLKHLEILKTSLSKKEISSSRVLHCFSTIFVVLTLLLFIKSFNLFYFYQYLLIINIALTLFSIENYSTVSFGIDLYCDFIKSQSR